MEKFQDVVIIGGGPSGSFTALCAAKKGANVTVFEEHGEIGIPSHCAGHLSLNGLSRLGLIPLPGKIIENIFYGAKFYSPNSLEFSVRFNSPMTCAVNRILFDKYLANLAEHSGAQYCLNSQVQSLYIEKTQVKGVTVRQNGKTLKASAKVVVDAEGISARLLKHLGLALPASSGIVYGFQAEVENVKNIDQEFVEIFLGKAYAPGLYAWIIPKRDGRAKVGLAAKRANPKELMRNLMKKHPIASSKLSNAKILKESLHPIGLGGPTSKIYSDGFLVVGDAACHVKPTTGGGVILGLNCAKIAAEIVSVALEKNDFSSKFLCTYQRRCNELLGFDIRVMLNIRKMLDKLSDKKLNALIDFYRRIRIDKAVGDVEEIDFQGRAILKAAKNPRIIAALAYFLFAYLFANV